MKGHDTQLRAAWRYDAGPGGLIWQLMFTAKGDLVGQKRFPDTRRAVLFGIDVPSGRAFSDDYLLMDDLLPASPGEGWFTGMETTTADLVCCYGYRPQSPEHQGIWAVDLRRERVRWSRPELVFAAHLGSELLVYRTSVFAGFPERHFLSIDPETGADIRIIGDDGPAVNALRDEAMAEEQRQEILLSELVSDGTGAGRLRLCAVGVAESVLSECILQGELLVAALHEPAGSGGLWNSSIRVWRGEQLIYQDRMDAGASRPGLNNFLCRRGRLYYIAGKSQLVSVAL
ncbi:MAG: hypothetical protein WCH05_01740 [Chlorobiaceae bacterium]